MKIWARLVLSIWLTKIHFTVSSCAYRVQAGLLDVGIIWKNEDNS